MAWIIIVRILVRLVVLMWIVGDPFSTVVGQGFSPQAIDSWQASIQANSERYGWSPDTPQVSWPCTPLKVVKQHSNNHIETFQLLSNNVIYTIESSTGIEKSIYLSDRFYCIQRQLGSDVWTLKQAIAREEADDWKWSPGPQFSYGGARTTARVLVDLPCWPSGVMKRFDEHIPADSVQLQSETEKTLTYRISTSENYTQSGEIILSTQHGFRPVSISLGNDTDQTKRQFQYHTDDFTEFDYQREILRKEGDSWVSIPRFGEKYKVKIDDQVTPQEFELAFYGIELEPRNAPYPSWWWLILAGAVLIGLAVWLRRRNAS
ncbi:MAG: hypothetical protein Q8M16_03860 [Pirellulaceae bacterium]|nr:hypothetical protein [Pirellulaceae bacterium]